MANLRELRDRIKSVNSTKKITKAQELIATSQISKSQARVAAAKPFADQMKDAAYYAKLARDRGQEFADYAAAQYAAGNPAYGGSPGGKRK